MQLKPSIDMMCLYVGGVITQTMQAMQKSKNIMCFILQFVNVVTKTKFVNVFL